MNDVTPERWLPIAGFEGLYEVSDLGRVRSVDRTVRHRNTTMALKGKILAQALGEHGYRRVSLYRDNKHTLRNVHILVAEAFLGLRPEGMDIRHGSNGISDNTPANLCYGTRVENMADKLRDGTHLEGSRVACAKLTEAIVRECRRRHDADGMTSQSLADEFGVTLATMWAAVHGKTWKHVVA